MKNSIYRRGARDLALAMNLVRDLTPALDLEEGERLEILTRTVVDPPATGGSGGNGAKKSRQL